MEGVSPVQVAGDGEVLLGQSLATKIDSTFFRLKILLCSDTAQPLIESSCFLWDEQNKIGGRLKLVASWSTQ